MRNKKEIKKKDIEVIIKEMIDEIIKIGGRPTEIYIKQEHYDELFKKIGKIEPPQIFMHPTEIVYYDKPMPMEIKEYKGLPLKVGIRTAIKFY